MSCLSASARKWRTSNFTKLTVSHEVLELIAEVKTAFYLLQGQEQLVTRLRSIEEIKIGRPSIWPSGNLPLEPSMSLT